jgi:hypothetical protein
MTLVPSLFQRPENDPEKNVPSLIAPRPDQEHSTPLLSGEAADTSVRETEIKKGTTT